MAWTTSDIIGKKKKKDKKRQRTKRKKEFTSQQHYSKQQTHENTHPEPVPDSENKFGCRIQPDTVKNNYSEAR